MKLETLKEMYPNSEYSKQTYNEDDFLVLFDGYQYLNIPRSDISINEEVLLKGYFKESKSYSEWYKYLVFKEKFKTDINDVQLIHFNVNKDEEIKQSWLQSFETFFDSHIDSFFIDNTYGVLILNNLSKSKDELMGIINMLDEDYSLSTTLYIGQKVSVNSLDKIYEEEQALFKSNENKEKINSFTGLYTSYYLSKSLEDSIISQNIKSILKSQKELEDLIVSLWNNQGNQSAVAKEIFVHRNTITYRIDKLYTENGIDLKDMEHLFLCYILIK